MGDKEEKEKEKHKYERDIRGYGSRNINDDTCQHYFISEIISMHRLQKLFSLRSRNEWEAGEN